MHDRIPAVGDSFVFNDNDTLGTTKIAELRDQDGDVFLILSTEGIESRIAWNAIEDRWEDVESDYSFELEDDEIDVEDEPGED